MLDGMAEFTPESTFRPLRPNEREILEKLLEVEFQGRGELRIQLDFVTAKQICADGTLDLECGCCPPAPVKWSTPVEGSCPDSDGGTIFVMLFVINGFIDKLEIIKCGKDQEIVTPPAANNLTVY
jgi:hypothetical protein